MNWADWVIVVMLGISVLFGLKRGFIREVVSLVAWLSALIISMLFYQRLAPLLDEVISTSSFRLLAAWAALFIAVLIVGALINYLIGKVVRATGLSGTDRLLGVVFGVARGAVIVMVILLALPAVLPVEQDTWWHSSLIIPEFLRFESWAREAGLRVVNFFGQLF